MTVRSPSPLGFGVSLQTLSRAHMLMSPGLQLFYQRPTDPFVVFECKDI